MADDIRSTLQAALGDAYAIERELPVSEAVRILREVASALAFAHRADVVHRDIARHEHEQEIERAGIWRVPAVGGTPELVVARDTLGTTAGYSRPRGPDVLPGGRGLLVTFPRGSTRQGDIASSETTDRPWRCRSIRSA